MFITVQQLNWCNSFVGSPSKNWNAYMSIFVMGAKMDVMFFKVSFIKLIINKVFNVLNCLLLKKKNILFIIPELVWLKSFFIQDIKITKNTYSLDLKNLFTVSFITWIFGTLTNYKNVFKYKKLISSYMPQMAFILTSSFNNDNILDVSGIANECQKVGILTIGLCSSHQSPFFFDYAVPSNSKSFEVSIFYYRLFVSFLYLNSIKFFSRFYLNLLKDLFII